MLELFVMHIEKLQFERVFVVSGLIIVLLMLDTNVSANQKTGFIHTPKPMLYEEEGRDVTMNWNFHIESRRQKSGIKDFLFGEWAHPGYVKYKILYMNSQHRVQPRPEYVSKVSFGVNIAWCANCSANVTIRNLTESDFKQYGIDILVGLHRSPLIHFFELRAPPKIIMFLRNLVVGRGNRTTIGCKAKGIPAPFVKIQKNNQTLCNGTRHCHYIIENVDTEDQGEYECIAKQGEKSDNSSMRLMVRKDDMQSTTSTETPNTLMIVLIVMVAIMVAILFGILYCKRKNTLYKFEKVEGGVHKI